MPAFVQNITGVTTLLGCYMQRFSASFGLNSSPTQIEIDLIPGSAASAIDIANNATGFIYASGEPGTLNRFRFGALDFIGHVRSYSENFGSDGRKFNVSLVDPRIIFPNVVLSLDGFGVGTGVYIPNYFNVFNYYGSPQAADSNRYGMTFSKIREFLETTGVIDAWGNKFILSFASGFQTMTTGVTNPSGIPSWYRIPAGQVSLDQLFQQISNDFNFDYHAYIDPSTYTPGATNRILVQHIFRNNDAAGSKEIQAFLSGALNSGVRLSYQYGKELRSDPTEVVACGPALTYWKCPSSSEIQRVWGETPNGTLIVNNFTGTSGIVSLENIKCSGFDRITNTVTVQNIDFFKHPTGLSYPPQVIRTVSTTNIKGYQPSENTLRAALYSQESWEAMLFKDHQDFASGQLGMVVQPYNGPNELISRPSDIAAAMGIARRGSGITDIDDTTKNLISNVYNATREVAENYYGTTWLVRAGSSNWLAENTYDSSELTPRLEFEAVSAAWSEPYKDVPSGATQNHPVLMSSSNLNLKTDLGLTKAFLSINDYDTVVDPTYFPWPVDISDYTPGEWLFDSNDKLVVPISVDVYQKEPSKAIVRVSRPLTELTVGSGYVRNNPHYDFLLAIGYTHAQITGFHMLDKGDDNLNYGLAPRRLHHNIPLSSNAYGFFIPVQRNEKNFAGVFATGTRHGGVNVIHDDSLAPWTYGNASVFNDACSGIVGRAFNSTTSVESAQISIAGIPVYNIGEKFGENANITAISISLGPDGLTTNYTIKTFNYPRTALTKTLQDKFGFAGGLGRFQRPPNTATIDFNFMNRSNPNGTFAMLKKEKEALSRLKYQSEFRVKIGNKRIRDSMPSQSNLITIQKASPQGVYIA